MILFRPIENYQEAEGLFLSRRDWLSAEENLRFSCYRRLEDRINFLLGRIIVKSILNPVEPQQVCLSIDHFGRPCCIAGNCSRFNQFSLSHTEGLVAVLFSTGKLAGLDVERMRPIDFVSMLETVAHPKEIARFRQNSQNKEAFYTFWTMKEAYLKLKGVGFIDQNIEPQTVDVEEEIIREGYCFVTQKIHDNYILSALSEPFLSEDNLQIEQWSG